MWNLQEWPPGKDRLETEVGAICCTQVEIRQPQGNLILALETFQLIDSGPLRLQDNLLTWSQLIANISHITVTSWPSQHFHNWPSDVQDWQELQHKGGDQLETATKEKFARKIIVWRREVGEKQGHQVFDIVVVW
jgi:hypothetical protein